MSSFGGAAPLLVALSSVQCVIATGLVLLRLYGASTYAGKMRWDFFWVSVSTVCSLVCQGLLINATRYGVGNHLVDVKLSELWTGLKMTWIGLMVGIVAVSAAKIGIVALLLQVTTPLQPKRRMLLWAVTVFLVVVNAAQMVISLTQCNPTEKLWYKLMPGSCPRAVLANNFGMFQGSVAVSVDLFLALYPTTIVWDLQISQRAKILFCVLMAGGLLPAAAGAMRTVYIPRLYTSSDPTYDLSAFLAWAMTELWFVIILGCIPPLRPLFERVFRKAKAITTRSGTRSDFENNSGRNFSLGDPFAKTVGSKSGEISKTSELIVTVLETSEEAEE